MYSLEDINHCWEDDIVVILNRSYSIGSISNVFIYFDLEVPHIM